MAILPAWYWRRMIQNGRSKVHLLQNNNHRSSAANFWKKNPSHLPEGILPVRYRRRMISIGLFQSSPATKQKDHRCNHNHWRAKNRAIPFKRSNLVPIFKFYSSIWCRGPDRPEEILSLSPTDSQFEPNRPFEITRELQLAISGFPIFPSDTSQLEPGPAEFVPSVWSEAS